MLEFLRLLRETERRAGFYSYDDPYFAAIASELLPSGEATVYFAMFEGTAVATAMVFDFGETRYYAYGAGENDARRLSPAPPLVWQTILDARERGETRYDFWGSAPPDAGIDHPWAGITYFKRAFGAQPVRYAGTWELTVRPLAARIFAVARRLRP
jgi:lipid II:glycine glycyltransferase (peptidoglycan interpeptide bridge formation enzyme)